MNGQMNGNQSTIAEKYEINKPLVHKIDSINDNCYRNCHNKCYHTIEYICEYDIKLTKTRDNEIANIKISVEGMNLYEINKKVTLSRQRGFIFNQINKLTKKFLLMDQI